MIVLYLALAGLATWRVAVMLVEEAGPAHVFSKLRDAVGIVRYPDGTEQVPDTFLAGVLSCQRCCSVWVALAATVAVWPGDDWRLWSLTPLALSGFAVLVQIVRGK